MQTSSPEQPASANPPTAGYPVAAPLVADHPALDFLNTRFTPAGKYVDVLANADGLLAWLHAASLLPDAGRHTCSLAPLHQLERIAAQARALRDWFAAFVDQHAGQTLALPDLSALRPLNLLLAKDAAFRQIHTPAAALTWTAPQHRDPANILLQPLAAAIGDLLCTADFRRVRRCHGPHCTLVFLDRTTTGGRRWCSMAVCGNRAKVNAHRQRHTSEVNATCHKSAARSA